MRYHFHNVLSPAKLNLGLKIVGKRQDGYHLLKSIFCLIDLCDSIDIQTTDNGKISLIEHYQAWFYQKDLSYRAAKLLQEETGSQFGANIKIKKVIPSGAGLGGGSSNAATVLLVLNQLWQTGLSNHELMALGLKLGADVPFFIQGHNALVEGIGEIITPLEVPQLYFVIIKPNFHIPTKDIFTNLNFNPQATTPSIITVEELLDKKINDLEPVARNVYPPLEDIFHELKQYEKYGTPVMTGSGSCIYFTFSDKNLAKKLAEILSTRYNTFLAASLPQSTVAACG
ncbi:MAG: 4-(cytidine 5'-diphospho)-2-C-methyl-D-erythritol kinase [Proteobacteria bacterium]|nr:MAG: 4-(cytidine 5'-diphospho)-2-C-methyl-D-erythritol kinase [Pseudomonadota bacterium]